MTGYDPAAYGDTWAADYDRLHPPDPRAEAAAARLAGLRLRERWAGWEREPFTADAPGHVSVFEPAP